MTQDELEFAISQYADDEPSPVERRAVERMLEEDNSALELLTEHRMLTAALRASTLPRVQWDALSDRINRRIDAEASPVADVLGRIDPQIAVARPAPMAMHRGSPWGGRTRWALAASVMLAAGIGLGVYLRGMGSNHSQQNAPFASTPGPTKPLAIATHPSDAPSQMVANNTPANGGAPETDIEIGPSPQWASTPSAVRYGMVPSRSHVSISPGGGPATQDSGDELFQR